VVRELVYLSEQKLASFVPDEPPWWRKLGRRSTFQLSTPVAGIGIAAQPPSDAHELRNAKLAAIIAEIERAARWYTEPDLPTGQWVQFEARMMGTVAQFRTVNGGPAHGLALFAAVQPDDVAEPRLVLHGSPRHLLEDSSHGEVVLDHDGRASAGPALSRFMYTVSRTPGEQRPTSFALPSRHGEALLRAITQLEQDAALLPETAEWLAGYARITMTAVNGFVCATPLYVQRLRP
jgi:hypothetical protein